MAVRYLVTTTQENWGDEIRGQGRYRNNVFTSLPDARRRLQRFQAAGVRDALIYTFEQP